MDICETYNINLFIILICINVIQFYYLTCCAYAVTFDKVP